MSNYFHRQIQLWGEQTQNSLKHKKILIIGSGGLGSSFAYALGASGIGEIQVVDFDTVSLHNIHRQILFTLNDEGKFKADIFKSVVQSRYDGVEVITHKMKFSEFVSKNSTKFDLIFDATDNLETRSCIDKFAKNTNTPWIYASTQAFHSQVCFFDKASFKPLLKDGINPEGLAAPIVMFAASFSANLGLRYLANLDVKKDTLYYLDISSGELKVSKFSLQKP
ncbi:HesA/MoeB/ThiF family protein [Campylobacter corcagiensis]|uniref:ThiF family adenylyltransferase n=1 Tax=Campylobacter corcagiensis TaxID=1448857 RepID=A0A7M1LGL2_9BACT|nr:ThiF family adenylyltransferase [Campylobacter corcagiensis]QKF64337.1 ThiF family protein [Campylobacter corcagiensis]QOQ87473.1 ThiF family adenylyltransferase [Campylobacter corcagiensis]